MASSKGPISATEQHGPLYFGFGSNKWLDQMKRRCPNSPYVGIAILEGWKWIINQRGYANVVPSEGDVVYGLVYELSSTDERTLDRCEGVPHVYTKQVHSIEFFREGVAPLGDGSKGETVNGLVYVDVERVLEGNPREEYIDRMNMAIRDALKVGVPQWYVDKYIRGSIPEARPSGSGPQDIF
jgi:gamma-glutamylcyclotransferase